MKAVFCHDGRYTVRADGQALSAAHFSSRSWDRYRREFDHLDVIGRELPQDLMSHSSLVRSDAPGVSFHTFPNLNSPRMWVANRSTARSRMTPLIESADALILRGVTGLGSVAFGIARRLGRPVALEMSGCPFDNSWNYGTLTGRLAAPFRYLIGRRTAASADYVIYVTQEFLQRRYPTRGAQEFASNVEIDAPDPGVLTARLERIRAAGSPVSLGLIGKVDHRLKGIDTAIRALAHARSDLPPFRLRILGEGSPDRWSTLAEQLGLGDRVSFEGTLEPGAPVLGWLDGIDLYLQPSLHEGLPRATIEAMGRGCPVLGSTAGGIPELIDRTWLHRPGDHVELAAQLTRLLADPSLAADLATKNFKRSGSYTTDVLTPRRTAFWKSFADSIRANRRR